MGNDFLKTNTPEVWTREQARTELFTMLETQLMKYEATDDYLGILKMARMILRLQMETMEEKTKGDDGKIITVQGKDTIMFQKQKQKINELEKSFRIVNRQYSDPAAKTNARAEMNTIIEQIKEAVDDLFHNNTVLGLNYRKKHDPMKAAFS